jgi:hypothetical protein
LVFVLAMLARLTGLIWGGVYYDEAFGRGAKVLAGQLVPDQPWYPPLLDYLNAVAYAALYAVGRLLGVWLNTAVFRDQYFENRALFILTARLVTATPGALSAPLAALIARQANWKWRAALILGQATLGSCVFLRQTLSPSVYWYAAQVLERIAVPDQTRIMAGFPAQLGLPLNAAVQREELQRHERLAAKYGVTLPPTAAERNGNRSVVTKGHHVRSYCFSRYFDDLPEDQFGQVRPFLWPLQQDEWDLQDWLDQGYTVFVVGNEPKV